MRVSWNPLVVIVPICGTAIVAPPLNVAWTSGGALNGWLKATVIPPIGTATVPRSRTSGTSTMNLASVSAIRLVEVLGAASAKRISAFAYS